jgi:hypothetical protein
MATFVDTHEDDSEVDNHEVDNSVEETETPTAAPESAVEDTESDLPEKYNGKSAAELAKMHANLEQLMGKQSQEVGELRKAFDEMVKASITQQSAAPEPEVDELDYWTDPKAAIERTLRNHPTIRQAEAVAVEMAKKEAVASLQAAHPDMQEILGNTQFQEWVKASEIRSSLYADADKNYNYKAAKELMDLWKERRTVVEQTKVVEKQAQRQEVKKAATGSSRSNPEGQATKKIYRRRDIIDLMNKDPKRYAALQPEIMKAYSEGRVR